MIQLELERPQRWLEPPWGMSQEWSLTMTEYKTCTKCGQIQLITEFYVDSYQKDGYRPSCKSCEKQRKTAFYYANKEKCIASANEWKKRNKDKVAISAAKYYQNSKDSKKLDRAASFKKWRSANPEKDLIRGQKRRAMRKNIAHFVVNKKDIVNLLAKPCIYCGAKSTQIDHVIPISRGGNHGVGNLVGACAPCNHSKKDKFITEWKIKK